MIERQQTTWMNGGLALVLLALLGALVVAPLGISFDHALPADSGALESLRALLLDASLQQAILRTLAVALLACAVASAIAIPAAFLAVRSGPYLRLTIQILGFLPLTMPPYISAAVVRHCASVVNHSDAAPALAELSVQGNAMVLVAVFALHYLPFILFSQIAGLQGIDRSLQESARNLGANRLHVWWRITLPLATPAYVAGASLVVLKILEDVGTPLMLGVEGMLAPQILLRLGAGGFSDPLLNVSALVLFVLSVLLVAIAWSALLPVHRPDAPTRCSEPLRWRSGFANRAMLATLTVVLGMLALAPHLWLLLMSLGDTWSGGLLPETYSLVHFRQLLGTELPQLATTLLYVAAAGGLTLMIGSLSAPPTRATGAVSRVVRFAATALFAIPGVVLALAYARSQDLFEAQLAGWSSLGWLALVCVVALKQLPFAQRLLAAQLRTLHQGRLASAHNLGVAPVAAYLRLGLPALGPVFVAVFLLGVVAAAMELSAALLLIKEPQAPLALSLFQALQAPATAGAGAAQAVLLVAVVATGLLLVHALLRRRCHALPKAPAHPTGARKDP